MWLGGINPKSFILKLFYFGILDILFIIVGYLKKNARC